MRDGGRLLGATLCALALAACSKGGAAVPDGGGEVGAPAGVTCQQIRMCVFDCAADACVSTCAAKGSAASQADSGLGTLSTNWLCNRSWVVR